MTRAVVDTNLLLRMAASENRSPLFVAWRERRFALVVSVEMLNEFESVITHPRVRRFLPPLRGQRFTTLLYALALSVTLLASFPTVETPKTISSWPLPSQPALVAW